MIAPAGTRQAGELVWDFEVAQDVRTQCRHRTTRYPLMQNKSRALNARDWPQRERERLAAIVNRELERAGVDRRYDPRTYAAMGIKKSARKSLSVDDFRREQRGEITEAGVKQAALLWAREHSKTAHKAARLQQEIDTLEARKPTRGMESDEHWALNMRRWENQLLRMRLNREIMLKNLARNRLESRSRLVPDARRSPCDRLVLHMADSMTQEIEALKLRSEEAMRAYSAAKGVLDENAVRFKEQQQGAYAARNAARRPAQNATPIPVIETPLPEPPPVMEVIPPEVAKSAADEQKRARGIRRQVMFARQRGGGGRGD